jgi:hypothetical protein
VLASILLPLVLLSGFAHAAGDGLTLHDPTFYPILPRLGSHLECRYSQGMDTYGVDLDRIAGNLVHATLITAGKSEGEKTAFVAEIKSQDYGETYLKFFKRDGDYGTYIEIVIDSQVSPSLAYRLPAKLMLTGATYSKEEDGRESEDLEPEGMHTMGCQPPVRDP